MEPGGQLSLVDVEEPPVPAPPTAPRPSSADRALLAALEVALAEARAAADDRPPLVVLASCLGQVGGSTTTESRAAPAIDSVRQARDGWLRRLETSCKSESARVAYRVAIDDLLVWLEERGRHALDEAAIVE